jgi:hypothetical protein
MDTSPGGENTQFVLVLHPLNSSSSTPIDPNNKFQPNNCHLDTSPQQHSQNLMLSREVNSEVHSSTSLPVSKQKADHSDFQTTPQQKPLNKQNSRRKTEAKKQQRTSDSEKESASMDLEARRWVIRGMHKGEVGMGRLRGRLGRLGMLGRRGESRGMVGEVVLVVDVGLMFEL